MRHHPLPHARHADHRDLIALYPNMFRRFAIRHELTNFLRKTFSCSLSDLSCRATRDHFYRCQCLLIPAATTFVANHDPTVLRAARGPAVFHHHLVNLPPVVFQQAVLLREVDLRLRFFRFVRWCTALPPKPEWTARLSLRSDVLFSSLLVVVPPPSTSIA